MRHGVAAALIISSKRKQRQKTLAASACIGSIGAAWQQRAYHNAGDMLQATCRAPRATHQRAHVSKIWQTTWRVI